MTNRIVFYHIRNFIARGRNYTYVKKKKKCFVRYRDYPIYFSLSKSACTRIGDTRRHKMCIRGLGAKTQIQVELGKGDGETQPEYLPL